MKLQHTTRVMTALVAAVVMLAAGCTPSVPPQGPYPAMPTTGRYVSVRYTTAQLQATANVEYRVAPDVSGSPVSLQMDLYVPPLPDGATALPTVVLVHGGGYIGGTRAELTNAARAYARRGFVAANIDYRIDPGGLGSVERWIQAATSAIDDGMDAARWLKAHAATYHVDTDRIAFVGTSAGGGVALGVGEATDVVPGGPLDAYSPTIAASVSTGATLSPGMDLGKVSFEPGDAPALMFHYDVDSVTTFSAEYSRRSCDMLVSVGSRCRFVRQAGTGHTVSISPDGAWWTSEIGPFLWAELRLATAPA